MAFEPPSDSPFWQRPGHYWGLVPEVPYDSYNEYIDLKEAASKEYAELLESVTQMSDMHASNLAYIGLPWDARHVLAMEGTNILLKFTKGVGHAWCDLVNSYLICILDATTRTYMHGRYTHPPRFEAALASLTDTLKKEASMFIRDRNLNPMGYYCFFYVNFKYFKSSADLDHKNEHNMPIRKFKDVMAAFVMGSHSRLGKDSFILMLDPDLLRLIFKFEIFD